ncbi:MAG: type I 3-dehydroquinate dehydratase [Verrucomicrobiota bacterium]
MKSNPTIGDIKTQISPPARRSVSWKTTPLTVGTISTEAGLGNLAHPPAGIDLAEVRLDLLLSKGVEPEKILPAMAKKEVPMLLTLRSREEGGSLNWRSRQSVLFFLAFLPFADVVDLELTNLPRLGRVLRAVRRSKRDLILSSHSLKRKLTPLRLKRLLAEFRKTRAAVYKIVGLARRTRDLRTLAEPLLTLPHMRLAILASGPLATASRLSLPALGSRLLYVHLDEPAAPGQPGHDTSFTFAGLRPFFSAKKS